MIDVRAVFVPVDGDVMATVGATPLTETVAVLPAPKPLVHWTLIELAPATRATELVVAEVEEPPFSWQVVPAGIVAPPLTV